MVLGPEERVGRYEIVKLLGRGAMGEVWLARDTKMFDELRAMKVLSEQLSNMEQARSRFTREVQTVAKLGDGAVELLLSNPTLIKRPVVADGTAIVVGYDEAAWATIGN